MLKVPQVDHLEGIKVRALKTTLEVIETNGKCTGINVSLNIRMSMREPNSHPLQKFELVVPVLYDTFDRLTNAVLPNNITGYLQRLNAEGFVDIKHPWHLVYKPSTRSDKKPRSGFKDLPLESQWITYSINYIPPTEDQKAFYIIQCSGSFLVTGKPTQVSTCTRLIEVAPDGQPVRTTFQNKIQTEERWQEALDRVSRQQYYWQMVQAALESALWETHPFGPGEG